MPLPAQKLQHQAVSKPSLLLQLLQLELLVEPSLTKVARRRHKSGPRRRHENEEQAEVVLVCRHLDTLAPLQFLSKRAATLAGKAAILERSGAQSRPTGQVGQAFQSREQVNHWRKRRLHHLPQAVSAPFEIDLVVPLQWALQLLPALIEPHHRHPNQKQARNLTAEFLFQVYRLNEVKTKSHQQQEFLLHRPCQEALLQKRQNEKARLSAWLCLSAELHLCKMRMKKSLLRRQ